MADYARRGNSARTQRSHGEQIRRLRTKRPLRGHVTVLQFTVPGFVTVATVVPAQLITIDPAGDGNYPEYKQIVGFDGWLHAGSVEVEWNANLGILLASHMVTGGSNRVMLPDPYIIGNGAFGGEFIQPGILDEDPGAGDPTEGLTLMALVETVPL